MRPYSADHKACKCSSWFPAPGKGLLACLYSVYVQCARAGSSARRWLLLCALILQATCDACGSFGMQKATCMQLVPYQTQSVCATDHCHCCCYCVCTCYNRCMPHPLRPLEDPGTSIASAGVFAGQLADTWGALLVSSLGAAARFCMLSCQP